VQAWFHSLKQKYELLPRNNSKHLKEPSIDPNSSEDESILSPENKISKHFMPHWSGRKKKWGFLD
jgi:hypothetical protein